VITRHDGSTYLLDDRSAAYVSQDEATLPMRDRVSEYLKDLQQRIIAAFEELDPNYKFFQDAWTRPQGGHGISGILSDIRAGPAITKMTPSVLEKAGVSISVLTGTLKAPAIAAKRTLSFDPESQAGLPFFVAGISLVIHPRNPHAPSVHANYRYFEVVSEPKEGQQSEVVAWWFGGGADLTPSYLYEEDAVHFHKTLHDACKPSGSAVYPAFKEWCDEYFYLPHRGESRGIGGIFYDDLSDIPHHKLENVGPTERPNTQEEIFSLMKNCGEAFLPSYLPILKRRMTMPFTEKERRWQLLRRGRYVEFNLVADRYAIAREPLVVTY
jgi:coproporphyrinogen III oxidase